MHMHRACLSSLTVKIIHGLTDCVVHRTHANDDLFRFRVSVIHKGFIFAAREAAHLVHIMFHNVRQGVIVLV